MKNQSPRYLYDIIPSKSGSHDTRNSDNIRQFREKRIFFRNSFFPSTIIEWNNLDLSIRTSKSLHVLKKNILKFIRPTTNNIYNIHNPKGLKYLTRLRLGFSHLREHKFKHNFQATIDPFCDCRSDIESVNHSLLHCPNFVNERETLRNKIKNIDSKILEMEDNCVTRILLFGENSYNVPVNASILSATIEFLISSKRFEGPLK